MYNDDRFENIPGRSSLIMLSLNTLQEINAFLDLSLWIIYGSEWAIRLITLPRLGQQFENLFVLHCKGQTRLYTR